jgi:large subunit ribosomal protein L28
MYGNNVSHSKRRTKTLFKANVHKQTLVLDGKPVKVKICTRCLRSQSRAPRLRQAPA